MPSQCFTAIEKTGYLAVATSDPGGDRQPERGDRYLNAGGIAADGPPLRVPGNSVVAILRAHWCRQGMSESPDKGWLELCA